MIGMPNKVLNNFYKTGEEAKNDSDYIGRRKANLFCTFIRSSYGW